MHVGISPLGDVALQAFGETGVLSEATWRALVALIHPFSHIAGASNAALLTRDGTERTRAS